jgi:AAA ATPase domain
LKLLAKVPEERYQSALGLREDLETCRLEWTKQRAIPVFALGRRDVSDRFLIPRRLYGRERDVSELQAVFERVCRQGAALCLVAGYSGIGKTSLIQEPRKTTRW